jgi:hypothetical protein
MAAPGITQLARVAAAPLDRVDDAAGAWKIPLERSAGKGAQDSTSGSKRAVCCYAVNIAFQMAEVAVSPDLFRRILDLIDDLRPKRIARC